MSKTLNSQNQIYKDCLVSSITAMLNVRFSDTLELMSNLDTRICKGETSFSDCSFQVLNGYKMYFKHMDVIDPEQYQNRLRHLVITM
jgi:hypothetical protein